MNVPIPPGLFDEPRVLEAEPCVVLAWVYSFRHCVARTNRQVSAGVWEPSRGVVARPRTPGQLAAVFGGHATFAEVQAAGLIVEHPSVPGSWMPFGYPIEAEEAYVSRAGSALNARLGKKARRTSVSVTDAVTGSVTQTRQDQTGRVSKGNLTGGEGLAEGEDREPADRQPDDWDDAQASWGGR